MKLIRTVIFGMALSLIHQFGFAQAANVNSFFQHLVSTGVEELTLTTDLTQLLESSQGELDYQPAELSYETANGEIVNWSLKIKPRGKYRLRTCDFPPIKLNFPKGDLRDAGFADFDKYKLVTHCDEVRSQAHETLLRELAIYKMYEAVTPASYQTHQLRIRYLDSKGQVSSVRRMAFMIESTAELAHRLQAKECEECLGLSPTQMDLETEHNQALFQFMVGNTDFSLEMLRNLKIMQGADGRYFPVPYDFDFAAMVDSPRAIPSSHLGQKTLAERIFMGFEVSDELAQTSLKHYEGLRPQFEQIIKDQRGLSSQVRFEMRSYLASFYESLAAMENHPSYGKLRSNSPEVVPPGGLPEHYGVRR